MSSEEFKVIFDCPECEKRLSVSEDKEGQTIYCPHCVQQIHVPGEMSLDDKFLAGLIADDEPRHPGSLKIDGFSSDAKDGSSWHIKCDICDSVLLVSQDQVGSQVKCNDCFTMLDVHPNRVIRDAAAGSDTAESDAGSIAATVSDSNDQNAGSSDGDSDFDELTLLPPVELPAEVTSAQKEILLDDPLAEPMLKATEDPLAVVPDVDDFPDQPLALTDPVAVERPPTEDLFAPTEDLFDLQVPDADEASDDEDSDEEIEIVGATADIAVRQSKPATDESPATQTLPRIPRKGRQQPKPVPAVDETDAPIRVHAKKKQGKRSSQVRPKTVADRYDVASADVADVLDKAIGIFGSGKLWMWATGCVVLMALGSGVWHSYAVNMVTGPDAGDEAMKNNLYYWGMGSLFGRSFFFLGYLLLMYLGGVVFRETAIGKVKIESVLVADRASFVNTMMLFGFSMLVAGFALMYIWYLFIVLPLQMLLAGFFLFAAWKNQNPYMIVSGSIAESFKHSSSWKNWFAVTGIAASGGVFGGLLMHVNWPVISIFTSIVGAFVVAVSILLYSAICGWHCGGVVEKMESGD